jgi:Kef-type K+ transport system membrane component KefB
MGCFYIFGSLEHLHGAQPSERTFLGLIPIVTSTNLTMRMFLSGRLKKRIEQ